MHTSALRVETLILGVLLFTGAVSAKGEGPVASRADMPAADATAAVAASDPLPVGLGHVEWDLEGILLEVFTFKPASFDGRRMIVVMHGVNRNADEYRDHSQAMGTRFNALIVAPRFDSERFPTSKYQLGGILTSDKQPASPEQWTYRLIPKLAHAVRIREQQPGMPYWIIGHSAGGQFVARMAAFADTGAERLVAANPGSHLFPTRDLPFGYGFGSLPDQLCDDETLRRYLAAPLTFYLGTADNKPDSNFDRRESAMQQGEGRWQRGRACFQLAQEVAAEKGWTCNWQLVEAADVPHDHERMFNHPQCAAALFDDQAKAVIAETVRQRLDTSDLLETAEEEMRRSDTPGAALGIVVGDELVLAKGLGLSNVETGQPVTPDMLFRLGSTTKMFTAALVVSLAEDGRLHLDEPIAKHLPGIDSAIGTRTPHQLLTHTAGLTDESIMSGLHDDSALAAGIRAMDSSWLFAEPGEIYSYANPGYWIAGLLAETLADQPYADALHARIFQPAGMQRSTLRPTLAMTWPLALGHEIRNGKPAIVRPQADNAATWPAGQVYSSVPDLARWVSLLLHQGNLDGQQILAPGVVSQLMAPHVTQPDGKTRYGYGFSTSQVSGVRVVQHGGSRTGYGSTIRLAPDHGVAVIVLTNRSGSSLPRTAAKALAIALGLESVAGEDADRSQPEALSENDRRGLAGVYTNQRRTIELAERDGELRLVRGGSTGVVRKTGGGRIGVYRPGDNGNANRALSSFLTVSDAAGNVQFLFSGGRAFKRQSPADTGF